MPENDTDAFMNRSVFFYPDDLAHNQEIEKPGNLTQQNFLFLLDSLGTITGYCNVTQSEGANDTPLIEYTQYTPKQNTAFDFLEKIKSY